MSLSTHVLDAVKGTPAAGVLVRLETASETASETGGDAAGKPPSEGGWRIVAEARTDGDGRIAQLGDPPRGVHRLRFDTGAYFAQLGVETFYPEVTVAFTVRDPAAHHHVPLLLSPFAFSTYRGS